jgi:hypothetical protein
MYSSSKFSNFFAEVSKYAPSVHTLRPGATIEEIVAAEKKLSIALPDSYRDFLRGWNGGSLFHDTIVIFGVPRAANDSDQTDNLITINNLKWPGMPVSYLVIAAYNYGDEICLVVEKTDPDEDVGVIRWDHETGKAVHKWPSLEAWLKSEMTSGSNTYNFDGSYKENALEKILLGFKRLFRGNARN